MRPLVNSQPILTKLRRAKNVRKVGRAQISIPIGCVRAILFTRALGAMLGPAIGCARNDKQAAGPR